MVKKKRKKLIDLEKESESTQLRYITAFMIKSYMNENKYTNNDILTKKITPEFFVEESHKKGLFLIQNEGSDEDAFIRFREVLYTVLVDFPDKVPNKKV